jgi:hypothetical protein
MNERKLQAYASLAEVISAVAIVVSLLYVAYEFRHTSTMSSREADLALFEREREGNRLLIEAPGLAEVVITASVAPQDLSEADRLRYLTFQHDFFDTWEIGWYYHADGILDGDVWAEWDEWFATVARDLPAFAWTENRRNFTGEEFRRHVDSIMGGIPSPDTS